MTGISLSALALMLAAAPSAALATAPSLGGFAKLPFPKERQAQAKAVEKIIGAVGAGDARALQAALAQGAALKVDSGVDTPLTIVALGGALDGCTDVVDYAIPADDSLLGIVWSCGGSERAAFFRFIGDRLASVRVATDYVAYAAPPAPPPPPRQSLTKAEIRSRAAVSSVRRHFGVIASRDPAELEALYSETASVPVSMAGGPGILRDFYQEQVVPQDGRQVRLTGCRTAPDFSKTERVDCTLIIDIPVANGASTRSTYSLGYRLNGRQVERVAVAQAAPVQASD